MTYCICSVLGPIGITCDIIGRIGKVVFQQLEKKLDLIKKNEKHLDKTFSLIFSFIDKVYICKKNIEKFKQNLNKYRKKSKCLNKIFSTIENITGKKNKIISNLNKEYNEITAMSKPRQEKIESFKQSITILKEHPNENIALAVKELSEQLELEKNQLFV